jgi:DNA-binding NtrC family response regulator
MNGSDPIPPSYPLARVLHGLVGESEAMAALYRKIAVYGPAEAPVLITGETGTGKELVARALHTASHRSNGPLVALNCAAVNEDLFESELFGHERGAFTGAVTLHRGRFERSDHGTLFLDEVGEMPRNVQAKFLRVLEDGTFERVGGESSLRGDVRVVAATNVPLEHAVRDRSFRADLYHRIAVLRIHVPPLRDRLADVPLLVDHFLHQLNGRYRRSVKRLTPEAVRLMQGYLWPGNVRELRNVLERVYVETVGDAIGVHAFDEWQAERELLAAGGWGAETFERERREGGSALIPPPRLAQVPPQGPFIDVVADRIGPGRTELTEDGIRAAVQRTRGNLTAAARLLGVHKTTLYRAMNRLGLTRDDLGEKDGE